jgi:hypothetical protein
LFVGPHGCIALDFSRLLFQRSDDSKASIFPLTYSDSNGTISVCQVEQTTPNTCDGKEFYVCREHCNRESHFCLPGPTDELALLLLGAAISQHDHRLHSSTPDIPIISRNIEFIPTKDGNISIG